MLTELKNHVNDILITCVDGLKGFPVCHQHSISEGPHPVMHRAYRARRPAAGHQKATKPSLAT
ncbi:hypothetical protein ACLB1R_00345 [Escherichia coli]